MAEIFPDCRESSNLMPVVLLAVGRCFYDQRTAYYGRLCGIFRPHLGNRQSDASDGKYHERIFSGSQQRRKRSWSCITPNRKSGTKKMPFPIRSGLKAKSSLITFPSNTRMVICRFCINISFTAHPNRDGCDHGRDRRGQDIADQSDPAVL